MSKYFRENGHIEVREFWTKDENGDLVAIDDRTQHCHKDDTDINKILARAQVEGSVSHLAKHGAHYADYSDFDFMEHQLKYNDGVNMFMELPSEVRREFNQSPGEFFAFVNDPANADRLRELLPAIAKPGTYFPDVSPATPPGSIANAPLEADAPPAPSEAPPAPPSAAPPVQST